MNKHYSINTTAHNIINRLHTQKTLFTPHTAIPLLYSFILVGLVLILATHTWRSWPDLLIDSGREVYVPWQIEHGAVLYRDIFHYYGPLGVTVNAMLFYCFGAAFSTLFFANILFLSLFTIGLFLFLGRLFNYHASLIAMTLFLCAFAFGNFTLIGNYNYLSPYSYDTVYGLYLAVAALVAFWKYFSSGRQRWMFVAGILTGITYLTKPEIFIAAAAVSGGTFIVSLSQQIRIGDSQTTPQLQSVIRLWTIWLICAFIPIAVCNAWFIMKIPGREGWLSIHNSLLAIIGNSALRTSHTNMAFMGLDNPLVNLRRIFVASAIGFIFLSTLGVLAWFVGYFSSRSRIVSLVATICTVIFVGFSLRFISRDYLSIGSTLVVSSAGLVLYRSICFFRTSNSYEISVRSAVRALWSLFSAALLLKMVMNPRIEHYGFFQAMPATLDLALFCMHDLPILVRRSGGSGKLMTIVSGTMVVTITFGLWQKASLLWTLKRYPVGNGGDMIRTYYPQIDPIGDIVNNLGQYIATNYPHTKTLCVFPEGVSLNYLFRMKNPVRLFEYVPPALAYYGQERLLDELAHHPPQLIVIISRDIGEFGSRVFGGSEASGLRILSWMKQHYRIKKCFGGNPLDPAQKGALLLELSPAP